MVISNNPEDPVISSEKDWGITETNSELKQDDNEEATKKDSPTGATLSELFQFATLNDKLLIIIAIFSAIGSGLSQPLLFLVFSDMIGIFGSYQVDLADQNADSDRKLQDAVNQLCLTFVGIGGAMFCVSYLQRTLWLIIGERQALRIRDKYYHAVLSQDMGWFDSVSSGEVANRLAGDVDKIQDGISDKIGSLIQYLTTFFGGFIIAMTKGWKLTLVMMSVMPLLVGSSVIFGKLVAATTTEGISAYGEAGSIASEVLAAIRTVYSFDAVAHEVNRYTAVINKARTKGIRKAVITGLGAGIVVAQIFLSYSLAMWYGGKLIRDKEYGPEDVLVVFLNVLVGSMTLGQTSPSLSALAIAQGAAASLLKVIYTESKIDPFTLTDDMKAAQSKLSPVNGNIEFKDIEFAYPNRLDRVVLSNIKFSVAVGQTVALVGSSGSGKSTTVGLLERFYDPQSGEVLLDGVDIKRLSTPFLRKHIGLVGQEPTLFATSIKENILLGLPDDYDEANAQNLVESACKSANIHEFIMSLPKRYDTLVGEKGCQLSGGQKQRIAIARAIIKNPPILLLDEATSALDTESERTVQKALESASKNRTTLVIAHRLSTIQHADQILVFDNGQIVEQGSHSELIKLGGAYSELVAKQSIRSEAVNSEPLKIGDGDITDNLGIAKEQDVVTDMDLVRKETEISNIVVSTEQNQNKINKENNTIFRVMGLTTPWIGLLLLGTLGSMLDGAVWPGYSILLTRVSQSFLDTMTPGLEAQGNDGVNFWALMFVVLAINCFVSGFLKTGVLSVLGEHISFEVRNRSFIVLTQQEVAYYDEPENGLGTLTARLSTEADQVQGLISRVYGTWVSALTCVLVSISLAFSSGWKLALVVLACIPLTVFAQLSELSALTSGNEKTKKIYQQVSQIAMESVVQIRTLASLSKEAYYYADYLKRVKDAHRISVRGFMTTGLGYGVAVASSHLVNALIFWYGTTLVVKREYTFQNMFQIITIINFMGSSITLVSSEMNTLFKSKSAAIEVFKLWDKKPSIDASDSYGSKSVSLNGNFDFSNAKFKYPSRKDVPILRGLDLSVLANKKIALVGASGSGKSTIISLIQRFYDLDSGKLSAEQQDIKQWNLSHLRSKMSVVGQEPVIFNLSIEDNIRYGALDPESITSEDIVRVAKLANAHEFISVLPEGYKTSVGERGSQISGGQKQRIAIARALIRDPKVLLLDEATSALDSQSESVVQDALDRAAENRTTITIAHRLSTVQDCDFIIVMKQGKLVEMGTHDSLLSKRGYYYSLVNSQSL